MYVCMYAEAEVARARRLSRSKSVVVLVEALDDHEALEALVVLTSVDSALPTNGMYVLCMYVEGPSWHKWPSSWTIYRGRSTWK